MSLNARPRFACTVLLTLLAACGGDGARELSAGGEVASTGKSAAAGSDGARAPNGGWVVGEPGTSSAVVTDTTAQPAGGPATGTPAAPDTTTRGKLPTGGSPDTNDSLWFAPIWARHKSPAPLAGAILPKNRIVSYYGNPHSKKMGILGELPPDEMMRRLEAQAREWEQADPSRPVVRMLELVAIVAQGDSGKDGMYRRREAKHIIDRVHGWARARKWQFMMDIQNGHSNYMAELEYLRPWLQQPDVHLALDPEFDMSDGVKPGRKIGTTDAAQVNEVVRALADIVEKHRLPPKVLVVHRFTRNMLTNVDKIRPDPRVQVVIDMDGWGAPFLKRATYRQYVAPYPVQYTGFKLFYHNDTKKGDRLMRPSDLLKMYPRPLFIQYQ